MNDFLHEAVEGSETPSGSGAAAVFAAGIGAMTLAVLSLVGDHSAAFKKHMIFYTPTGALSGVTTLAVVVWLMLWVVLDRTWRRSDTKGWAIVGGVALLAVAFMLMVPAVGDLF